MLVPFISLLPIIEGGYMRSVKSFIASIATLFMFSCSAIVNTDGGGSNTIKPDGNDNISTATELTLG